MDEIAESMADHDRDQVVQPTQVACRHESVPDRRLAFRPDMLRGAGMFLR
jgi:hypothetical protein